MDVRRNSRFGLNQGLRVYYNPVTKLTSGTMSGYLTYGTYEVFLEYWGWYSGSSSSVEVNDIFACKYFGGRVAAITSNTLTIGLTYDTFAENNYEYIKDYLSTDAFIFSRGTVAGGEDYFYCLSGSGYLVNSPDGATASDDSIIVDSFVSERSIKVNNERFGYGYQHYNSGWEDIIKISMPATTPEWKLTQMLNSSTVAVKGNSDISGTLDILSEYGTEYDTEYGTDVAGSGYYTLIDNYNYYQQHNGGSCSPVIRLISIDRTTLNFNSRRNVIEVEAVILG